jgi:hypothetical protein
MLSAFMAFIEPGDEVIIFEPFFDQLVLPNSNYLSAWFVLMCWMKQIYQQH